MRWFVRTGWVSGLALAAIACGAGAATKAPQPEKDDAKPYGEWARLPSGEERTQAMNALVQGGVPGRGVARCAVGDKGEIKDCRLVSEAPVGSGWGKAVLALAGKYRRKPPGPVSAREINLVEGWYPADRQPDWLRKPTAEQLLAVYPTDAYSRGINGKATITCLTSPQGRLLDCVTLEESPVGAGFGAAAIALTPQFLMKPAEVGGKPVVSAIRMPINFVTYGPGDTGPPGKKVLPPNLAWSEAPSYADVAAAYPPKARAERRGGRVTMACGMTETGRLKDCDVLTTEPRGYGFDTAGRALVRRFALPITDETQRKATHRVTVHLPITFDPAMLDQATPVIGKPSWAATPSAAELQAAFAKVNVTGTVRVSLTCRVQPGGALASCVVTSESPTGSGVGDAAMALAPLLRMTTWSTEGLPVVGGSIQVPLRYEGKAAPPPPGD